MVRKEVASKQQIVARVVLVVQLCGKRLESLERLANFRALRHLA
jgi:hypothetical protein